MNAAQIISTMRYLGYVTHDKDGNLCEAIEETAKALDGKVSEYITLSPTIATEYARQKRIIRERKETA